MSNDHVDQHLLAKFRKGECVFFVGAGVSATSGLRTGQQFHDLLISELKYPWDTAPLSKVAQAYEDLYDRNSLVDHVKTEFGRTVNPAPTHMLIAELASGYCSHIVTTNYDQLLEKALENQGFDYYVSTTDKQVSFSEKKLHLVKFHGSVDIPETIALTDTDYRNLFASRPILRNLLGGLLAQKTFLFVGYSLEDTDFDQIYHGIALAMGEFQRLSYAVQRKPAMLSDEDWKRFQVDPWTRRQIRIITGDQVDVLSELKRKLEKSTPPPANSERLVGEILYRDYQGFVIGDINSSDWKRLTTEDLLNCMVEVEFQVENDRAPDDWFGVRVRGTTNYFHSGYLIYVRSNGSLDVTSVEERSVLPTEKRTISPRTRFVKLTVQMIGDHIIVLMNGEQVIDIHNTLVSWPGKVYLHTWETQVRIRSIVITN